MDEAISTGVRAMLIDLIDQIMGRPLYNVLVEDGEENPFVSLKKKLESNSKMTLDQFHSPIKEFFDESKSKSAKYVSDAAIVLEKIYDKKFNLINSFSNYCFKDILLESAQKVFPNIESLPQSSENNNKSENGQVSIPHRGKKNTKNVRIVQNEQHGSAEENEYTDDNDENFEG